MALVRIPAPLRTSSCPPTETLSSSLTPPTSAAIATAVDSASATLSSRLDDVLIRPPGLLKRSAAGLCLRRIVGRVPRLLLHRVRELQPNDVDVAAVRTADQAVGGGVAFVLIDVRIFYPDVRISEIERKVGRELVLRADRHPGPVVVRQPRRAELIANRRLIIRNAAAERPLVVVAIVCADRTAPGIAEVLRRVRQDDARAADDLQLLNGIPARVLQVRHQVPLVIELVEDRNVGGVGHFDRERNVAIREHSVHGIHEEGPDGRQRRRKRAERGSGRVAETDGSAYGVLDLRAIGGAKSRLVAGLPQDSDIPAPAVVVARDVTPRLQSNRGSDERRRDCYRNLPGRHASADCLSEGTSVIHLTGQC